MFDSPIAACDAIHEYVLTDQSQEQCRREHSCLPDRVCPLAGYFVESNPMVASDDNAERHCRSWTADA